MCRPSCMHCLRVIKTPALPLQEVRVMDDEEFKLVFSAGY